MVKLDMYEVLKAPLVNEKSREMMQRFNKYTFAVDKRATKTDIKKAVENIFKVKVVKVNVMNYKGKRKRRGYHIDKRSDWKKAIVTLKESDRIKIEGIEMFG